MSGSSVTPPSSIGKNFATLLGAIAQKAKDADAAAKKIPDNYNFATIPANFDFSDVKGKADAAAVRETVNDALAAKASNQDLNAVKATADAARDELAIIGTEISTLASTLGVTL